MSSEKRAMLRAWYVVICAALITNVYAVYAWGSDKVPKFLDINIFGYIWLIAGIIVFIFFRKLFGIEGKAQRVTFIVCILALIMSFIVRDVVPSVFSKPEEALWSSTLFIIFILSYLRICKLNGLL